MKWIQIWKKWKIKKIKERERTNIHTIMRKKNRLLARKVKRMVREVGGDGNTKWNQKVAYSLCSSFTLHLSHQWNGLVIFQKEGRKKGSTAWILDDTGQKKGKCWWLAFWSKAWGCLSRSAEKGEQTCSSGRMGEVVWLAVFLMAFISCNGE